MQASLYLPESSCGSFTRGPQDYFQKDFLDNVERFCMRCSHFWKGCHFLTEGGCLAFVPVDIFPAICY